MAFGISQKSRAAKDISQALAWKNFGNAEDLKE